jgi:hypothetical protein
MKIYSPFYEPALKFFSESEHIFLESFCFLHLSAQDVVLYRFLIYLIDSKGAEVTSGSGENLYSITVVNLQKTIFLELAILYGVLVSLIEDEVENLFGLDISGSVGLPEISCCELVFIILTGNFRDDHQLLESIIEVLLVIVEGRILNLFLLLALLTGSLVANLS